MRVLVLGIAGVQKRDYVNQVINVARKLDGGPANQGKTESKWIRLHDLEKQVRESQGGAPRFTSFLDNPDREEQKRILKNEFQAILETIGTYEPGPPHEFLLLHGTYLRNKNYFSRINKELLDEFQPTVVVTLIDDFYDVVEQIKEREQRVKTGSTVGPEDVLIWRNIETMVGDIINNMIKYSRRHFVVPVKHPPITLYRLLFERFRLRLYTAYPMRTTRTHPNRVKELNSFREKLYESYTVFDPRTIDEHFLLPINEVHDEGYIAETSSKNIALLKRQPIAFDQHTPDKMRSLSNVTSISMIQRLKERINSNIENRDFRLIDQSNAMVGYRPKWGASRVSTGVKNETEHAIRQHKGVFLVHPSEDGDISEGPFATKGTLYSSVNELLEGVEEWQKEYKSKIDEPTWEFCI